MTASTNLPGEIPSQLSGSTLVSPSSIANGRLSNETSEEPAELLQIGALKYLVRPRLGGQRNWIVSDILLARSSMGSCSPYNGHKIMARKKVHEEAYREHEAVPFSHLRFAAVVAFSMSKRNQELDTCSNLATPRIGSCLNLLSLKDSAGFCLQHNSDVQPGQRRLVQEHRILSPGHGSRHSPGDTVNGPQKRGGGGEPLRSKSVENVNDRYLLPSIIPQSPRTIVSFLFDATTTSSDES